MHDDDPALDPVLPGSGERADPREEFAKLKARNGPELTEAIRDQVRAGMGRAGFISRRAYACGCGPGKRVRPGRYVMRSGKMVRA